MKSSWAKIAIAGCIGVVVGAVISFFFIAPQNAGGVSKDCTKKYSLTSQSLDCDAYDESNASLKALDAELDAATANYVSSGKASHVSVWVRDLETRQWASSNEFELYSPASLFKLPLAIAYYKYSELDPQILDQSITFNASSTMEDPTLVFTPKTTLKSGATYKVSDLINDMLIKSDNGATNTLFGRIEPGFYTQVQLELGIQIPNEVNPLDYVTVKTYGNIFRVLYNASYVNRALSQKILGELTKSEFKGIAEPLPSNVVVAHKFGERTVVGPNGQQGKRELHDCGIVYKNPHPYTLCIMTEGTNFDDLLYIIKGVSKLVYDNI